jgi:hypothetical protein
MRCFRSVSFLACLIIIIALGVLPSAFFAAPRSASNPMPHPEFAQAEAPKAMFGKAVDYSTVNVQPDAIAAIDVNRDGKVDLVVLNSCVGYNNCPNGTAAVLLGNGDGTFQSAVTYNSGGTPALNMVAADMNGDGRPDLIIENGNNIAVLLGNSNGTFQPAVITSISGIGGLAVADMDGDGKLDAVVTTATGIAVLFGNGDGTFQPPVTTTTPIAGSPLGVGDLNGDGIPDAVIVTSQGSTDSRIDGTVAVLLGNGNGSFQNPNDYDCQGFNPQQLVIADLANVDGKPEDILVVNQIGRKNGSTGNVGEFINDGKGDFQTAVAYPGGHNAFGVAVGDLNGDGTPDLAVSTGRNVALVITNGQLLHLSGTDGGAGMVIADFNGDGMPDLASATCINFGGCSTGEAAVYLAKPDKTKTTVTTSGSPSTVGQPVTFTATVSSSRGPAPDGQTITFLDGNKSLGTAPTTGGVAQFTTSSLQAGTHTIKAKFGGCAFFKASEGTVKQVVNP